LDLNLWKGLAKCQSWSIALFGGENWTLRKEREEKYGESFEVLCWRRMKKFSWTDSVTNEGGLYGVKGERKVLRAIREGRQTGLFTCGVENAF